MFVRTKKVGEHEYYQLVENYREDGRHRQRVVAHLGRHGTPEEALEAAREDLEALEGGDLQGRAERAEREAAHHVALIEKHFPAGLRRYHRDELPTINEVYRLMGMTERAPDTDEVVTTDYGWSFRKRAEVEYTPEQYDYCRAFTFEWAEPKERSYPDLYGHTLEFSGNRWFLDRLRSYHYLKDVATGKRAEYERKKTKLEERIAKLESVVTRMAKA